MEEMTLEKMLNELTTKCKSSSGFMTVDYDQVTNTEDLIEKVKDEIFSISAVLDSGYIKEDVGMSEREAKGYLKKLNTFVERNNNTDIEIYGENTKGEKVKAISINKLFKEFKCTTKNKQITEMLNQKVLVTQWDGNSYHVVGTKKKIIYISAKKSGNVMSVWN